MVQINNMVRIMKYILGFLSIIVLTIYISGCSELQPDIEEPAQLTVHNEGITDPDSPDFHGDLVRDNNWDMNECKQCHGSNYADGITDASCFSCHDQLAGPENCSTCHGSETSPAPPRDLSENISTTEPGVGAHQVHLTGTNYSRIISCTECHSVPSGVYVPGHVDSDSPAEINFGWIARSNLGVTSNYNYSNSTCSNTFCHGNWEFLQSTSHYPEIAWDNTVMRGNNNSVIWNAVDGSQAQCGSCHGLPPEGHIEYTIDLCGSCHQGIVDVNGNIVDSLKYKHINGLRNVFDDEY